MKIIIVDDEQALVKMYSSALEMAGFEVISASDGKMAIETINKEKPDAILLDIIMPQINGLDVLKQLKEKEETKKIPVFLLTNLPEESALSKANSLGAEDYFVKAQTEPQQMAEVLQKYFSENSTNN